MAKKRVALTAPSSQAAKTKATTTTKKVATKKDASQSRAPKRGSVHRVAAAQQPPKSNPARTAKAAKTAAPSNRRARRPAAHSRQQRQGFAAVLSIGTEVMRGEIINTNAAWLAAELTGAGFTVIACDGCDDDDARIRAHLRRLSRSVAVVVCTGGLGPTTDDITTASVAKLIKQPLVRHQPSVDAMQARFAAIGRSMTENNLKQADFPKYATVLPNPLGTAPGFMVDIDGARCAFMPGVPSEQRRMMQSEVLPRIQKLAPATAFQIKVQTFGEAEATIGQKLQHLEQELPGLVIGYRPHFPEIELKMLARGKTLQESQQIARTAADRCKAILAEVVFGEGDDGYVESTLALMRQRQATLTLAESCTGGLLSQMLTARPTSDVLFGSFVTYDNQAKREWLSVPNYTLQQHGAVSEPTARAMAEAALRLGHTSHALSITGIAGPGGGSDDKPVGTVFVALAQSGAATVVKQLALRGDRHRIQTLAAYHALRMLRGALLG